MDKKDAEIPSSVTINPDEQAFSEKLTQIYKISGERCVAEFTRDPSFQRLATELLATPEAQSIHSREFDLAFSEFSARRKEVIAQGLNQDSDQELSSLGRQVVILSTLFAFPPRRGPNIQQPSDCFTIPEASARLGMSRNAIRNEISKGKLSQRPDGLITRDELKRYRALLDYSRGKRFIIFDDPSNQLTESLRTCVDKIISLDDGSNAIELNRALEPSEVTELIKELGNKVRILSGTAFIDFCKHLKEKGE